jgi:hypothetical protein
VRSKTLADLEEDDEADPVKQFQEIPEQSLEDDSNSVPQDPKISKVVPSQNNANLKDLEETETTDSDTTDTFSDDEEVSISTTFSLASQIFLIQHSSFFDTELG